MPEVDQWDHHDRGIRREEDVDDSELASHIDHTVLEPDAGRSDIERACEVARAARVCGSLCQPDPRRSRESAARGLRGPRGCCGRLSFRGDVYTAVKVLETELAIRDGADEIDMVLAIGQLRDDELEYVKSDIAAVVRAAAGRPVKKLILECGLLTDAQKRQGAEIAATAGAAFVKTSTGFLGSGATAHDVRLLDRGGRYQVVDQGHWRHPFLRGCGGHAGGGRLPPRSQSHGVDSGFATGDREGCPIGYSRSAKPHGRSI